MGSGMNKDGSKEAYWKNFRRMLHEGGAEGGAGARSPYEIFLQTLCLRVFEIRVSLTRHRQRKSFLSKFGNSESGRTAWLIS